MRFAAVIAGVLCALSVPGPASAQAPVLPGLGGSVCDFVAMNAGRTVGAPEVMHPKPPGASYDWDKPFGALLTKRALADVDGDGDVELLDIGASGGTAHGDVPNLFGADKWTGYLLPPEYEDSIRWAYGARWLNFEDAWYLVYFADEQLEQAMAIVTITGGGRYACLFNHDYDEEVSYSNNDPLIRAAYEKRQTGRNSREWHENQIANGSPLTAADKRYLTSIRDGFEESNGGLRGRGDNRSITADLSTSVIHADLDGDGVKERLARLGVSSGAGRGCDTDFLELLPEEDRPEPVRAMRDGIRKLQGGDEISLPVVCGTKNEIVEIGGRGYFYLERLGNSGRMRRLVELRNNFGLWVVSSEFRPRHTVTFDAAKGGAIRPPN